ncbi:hypothetical protein G6F24_014972 [Rhizopus arrhizus]|nr:hypothetical protein G6F24_014972 [Rhizopus arrhizus]
MPRRGCRLSSPTGRRKRPWRRTAGGSCGPTRLAYRTRHRPPARRLRRVPRQARQCVPRRQNALRPAWRRRRCRTGRTDGRSASRQCAGNGSWADFGTSGVIQNRQRPSPHFARGGPSRAWLLADAR